MVTHKKHYLKLSAAALLVLGSLVFVYGQYKASIAPKPPEVNWILNPNGDDSSGRAGPINKGEIQKMFPAQERKQMREDIYVRLEFSAEQREKMEKIAQKYDGRFTPEAFQGRMKEWKEVLTPEQWANGQEMRGEIMQRVGERIRSRIMQRAGILPEAERRKFEEKLDQRIQERQQRVEKRLNELNNNTQQSTGDGK
jgi:hypothetical protein